MIFDQVKAFVLDNRSGPSSSMRKALLQMPNVFSAGDKAFISTLAEDLHLTITWDEYDEQDQNLLIWRFPGSLEEPIPSSNGTDGDDEVESEEDEEEEEEEGREAVDRVLKKYETAKVAMENAHDNFDMREEQRIKEKMDEWKRAYYRVRGIIPFVTEQNLYLFRISCRYLTMTRSKCDSSFIGILKVCNGSCTIITAGFAPGDGSMIIIMRHGYQVHFSSLSCGYTLTLLLRPDRY